MAFDTALAARLRNAFPADVSVQERKMFGGLALLVDGHMCCGVLDDRLMVRIAPDRYEAALQEPHVRQMDFTGRPMRGFVYVAPEGIASDAALRSWVERALAFTSTLPPKK